jgi:hypothetical protein
VEAEYTKRKKIYDALQSSIQGERSKLEVDVNANITSIMEEESSYHFIHCLSLIDQVRRDQVAQEQRYLAGEEKFSAEHKTYKDMYDRVISEQVTCSTHPHTYSSPAQSINVSHIIRGIRMSSMYVCVCVCVNRRI